MNNVVIVSMSRTPIGAFLGQLKSFTAPTLCGLSIKETLQKVSISPDKIDEVFIGNVISAGIGQAPAKQAAKYGGIPDHVPCTTINKVCASGLKSISIGVQSIMTGDNEIVLAGGMESMSKIPHYLQRRTNKKLGNDNLIDGLLFDGLTNVYDQNHMGVCSDKCAKDYNLSREALDEYTKTSYKKAFEAWKHNRFDNEVFPITVPQRGGNIISDKDEEYTNVYFEKIPSLKPVFTADGTTTAANASTISDGAATVLLMSERKAKELKLKPLAKVIQYSDASQKPENYTTSPALAIKKLLSKSNIKIADIDAFEINEAFASVVLANQKILDIDIEKINVNGGGISLGHPLGMSGTRILMSLISVLKQQSGKFGIASICNGGGGATAMLIQNL